MAITPDQLAKIVEEELPEFAKVCKAEDSQAVLLTQDAFGDGNAEIILLAGAIKYAGAHNKIVTILPKNVT